MADKEVKTPAETVPKQPGAGVSDPKMANQTRSVPGEAKPNSADDLLRKR